MIKCTILSERVYGQPKLRKPKILQNVIQRGNAVWIPKKCTCPVYVVGAGDIYILHRDWFSKLFIPPKDTGMPLNEVLRTYFPDMKTKRERFIYGDCWGGVVLRNEAWLKFEGVSDCHEYDRPHSMVLSLADALGIEWYSNDFDYCQWLRFFESVCNVCITMLNKM